MQLPLNTNKSIFEQKKVKWMQKTAVKKTNDLLTHI